MGDQWWETVANDFVGHYYTSFDTSADARVQLAGLYVRRVGVTVAFHLFHRMGTRV